VQYYFKFIQCVIACFLISSCTSGIQNQDLTQLSLSPSNANSGSNTNIVPVTSSTVVTSSTTTVPPTTTTSSTTTTSTTTTVPVTPTTSTTTSASAVNTVTPPVNNTSAKTGTNANMGVGTHLTPPKVAGYDPAVTWSVVAAKVAHPQISLKDIDNAKSAISGTASNPYLVTAAKRLKSATDYIVTAVIKGQKPSLYFRFKLTDLIYVYYIFKDYKSYAVGEPTAQDYLTAAIKMQDDIVTSEFDLIAAGQEPNIRYNSSLYMGDDLRDISFVYDYGYSLLTAEQKLKWVAYAEQVMSNFWSGVTSGYSTSAQTYLQWSDSGKMYVTPVAGSYTNKWCYQNNWTSTGSVNDKTQVCKVLSTVFGQWAIDNAASNYFHSFFVGAVTWALASQNQNWLNLLKGYAFPLIQDYFTVNPGGGAREGTSYNDNLALLFEGFRYWKSTTGEDLSSYTNHVRDSILFFINLSTPDLAYYAPYGDHSRDANPYMFDYKRAIMLEAVNLKASTTEGRKGQYWLNHLNLGSGAGVMRFNFNYRWDLLNHAEVSELAPTDSLNPSPTLDFSATAGILNVRSTWSSDALFYSTYGGVFDESHQHMEQGTFTLYKNGWLTVPVTIYDLCGLCGQPDDKNVVRFKDPTGSTMQEYWPDYDRGIRYSPVQTVLSYSDDGNLVATKIAIDATLFQNSLPWKRDPVQYVGNWTRTMNFNRNQQTLSVHDECQVMNGGSSGFLLHVPAKPVISGNVITAGKLKITLNSKGAITYTDYKIVNGSTVDYRIEISSTESSKCSYDVTLQAL